MTDSEAIQHIRSGDMEGLRVLYERHRGRIYQLGCRYLGDAAEAEDLVQQVFIKAYENAAKFRGEAQVSTWLYRIAVNAALERRRRRRTVGIEDVHPLGAEALATTANLEAEVRSGWPRRPAMAGRDFDAIELNALVFTIAVTDDSKPIYELIASSTGLSRDQIVDSPLFLVGSADEITDKLEQRREQTGISYIVVQGDDMAQLELFAEHVVVPLTGR